jgi:malate dehydrogenase
MNRKVTVVGGAGNVGATVARAIADQELADVVIIDIADQKAAGVALDMLEACPIEGSDARVVGYGATAEGWAQTADSDVVVITSGVPRKPGMSRDDLLQINYRIMQSVTEKIVQHSPDTIIVPVANPLDAMCQAVYRLSRFPRERVIGMAGVLDSARMRTFIAIELNVSVENVHAFVLGGHGDTMVPLPRFSTVAGIPITELLTKERIDAISRRTADGGAEITKLVGTSAPAVFRVPAGRVRHPRSVRRCTGQARGARRGTDSRDRADAGRGRRAEEVGRRREGARRRHPGVNAERPAGLPARPTARRPRASP